MLVGLLAGCGGGGCDDRCHAERAQSAMLSDVAVAIEEIAQIEDPVLRTAVIMEAVRQPSLTISPDQAIVLCKSAPNSATRTHCENRFLRPHLQPQDSRRH